MRAIGNEFDLIVKAAQVNPDAFVAMTEWMLGGDHTVLPTENAEVREFLAKDGVLLESQ